MIVTKKAIRTVVLEALQEASPRLTKQEFPQQDTRPLATADKSTLKSKTGNICWQSMVKAMHRLSDQNEELFSLLVQRLSDTYSREAGGYTNDCQPDWGSARSIMLGRGQRTQLDPATLMRKAPKHIGEALGDDAVDQLVDQIMSVKSPDLRRHLVDTVMAAEGQTDKELHAAIDYVTRTLEKQLEG